MNRQFFTVLIFSALYLTNCSLGVNSVERKLTGDLVMPFGTKDTVLFVESIDGIEIPIFISFPSSDFFNYPGVVVMHGSGGNWRDSDTDNDGIADVVEEWELSSQNTFWKNKFDTLKVVTAFPGSYYRRGTVENEGEWKNPPLQFKISATFIRNYDAYITLFVLRNLRWENGSNILNANNIGLLGFSHGGTAVQSSIYDALSTPEGWEWSQSYDGVEYTEEMIEPVLPSSEGGFKTAVMYYPGSFHNGYYGNPCNGTSIYKTYTDFLIHLPSEDPLTPNSECMLDTIEGKGGFATVYRYEGAGHGFDNARSGQDATSNTLARERTIEYLSEKLVLDN